MNFNWLQVKSILQHSSSLSSLWWCLKIKALCNSFCIQLQLLRSKLLQITFFNFELSKSIFAKSIKIKTESCSKINSLTSRTLNFNISNKMLLKYCKKFWWRLNLKCMLQLLNSLIVTKAQSFYFWNTFIIQHLIASHWMKMTFYLCFYMFIIVTCFWCSKNYLCILTLFAKTLQLIWSTSFLKRKCMKLVIRSTFWILYFHCLKIWIHLVTRRIFNFSMNKDMLRVCRDWIEFSSQQALEVLAHVELLASTLYSSAFDTRANLLRSLCFALL